MPAEPNDAVDAIDPIAAAAELLGVDIADVAEVIVSDADVRKAVRGGLAELLLERHLRSLPEVASVRPPARRGDPDRLVTLTDGRAVRLESKLADAATLADGAVRVDLRRAGTPQERLYPPDAFDVVACCLHPHTGRWEFRFAPVAWLSRRVVPGPDGPAERLEPNQRVDAAWRDDFSAVLDAVASGSPRDVFVAQQLDL